MIKHRPSPTAVVALLALFFALGGTAFAAKHYIISSTGQIKPSVLRSLKGRTGPKGPQGPQGPQGPTGTQGPAGPSSIATVTEVDGPSNSIPAGDADSSIATCPAGQRVISGGGAAITDAGDGLAASESSVDEQSWFVVAANTGAATGSIQAIAFCAPSGQAVATGAAGERARDEADAIVERLDGAMHAAH